MFTDSHFHVDHFELKNTVPDLVTAARDASVTRMIAIGGSDDANLRALRTAQSHPGLIWATAGYDRDLAPGWNQDLSTLTPLFDHPEIVAVGESGIDYFHREIDPAAQRRLFEAMLDLALRVRKPVIIHSRDADDDTLALLKPFAERWPLPHRPCGVLHCFTGSTDFAAKLLDLNLMISFSGILTFKNAADLREAAATIPDDRLLIETDSPYLAPVPHRGQRNQPAWVPHVAACLADIRHTTPDTIGTLTTANACRVFDIP